MSTPSSGLPARPSLEQLRKRAKELLRAVRNGDDAAVVRFRGADSRWSQHSPTSAILADAQLVIAREHGYASWQQLVHAVEVRTRDASLTTPLIRPVELAPGRTFPLLDGTPAAADDVYAMFVATRAGDVRDVKRLIERTPGLATVEYNYTPPIHFAVREGHLALVRFLIEHGADIAAYRSYPFGDALLTIAEDHEHADVAALLRAQLSRRFRLADHSREIIDAARAGDVARVQAELARDPAVARASDETGDTALHHAAHQGNLELVHLLLDAGADADAMRGDGYRPIHLALLPAWQSRTPRDRSLAVAELLLAHGARYTLYSAVLRGDRDFIRDSLRRNPASAREEDTCHHRPLSAAARRNDIETARLLLEHGADPNAREEGALRGQALWQAVHNRNYDLTRLLLEHGADPNAMVESSGTPMGMAHDQPELRALLRAHGGREDPTNDDLTRLAEQRRFDELERIIRARPELLEDPGGEGILMGAASAGNHEMILFLMRLGARVPTITKWGPYYYFKHEATAAFLLEHGMDANHMNWHRYTLLHHMAAEGELNKARLLLDHGADIDAIDEEYRSTPLGVAARRGQRELVKLLLERGADRERGGAAWATPLAWARKKGHDDVANMLTTSANA